MAKLHKRARTHREGAYRHPVLCCRKGTPLKNKTCLSTVQICKKVFDTKKVVQFFCGNITKQLQSFIMSTNHWLYNLSLSSTEIESHGLNGILVVFHVFYFYHFQLIIIQYWSQLLEIVYIDQHHNIKKQLNLFSHLLE